MKIGDLISAEEIEKAHVVAVMAKVKVKEDAAAILKINRTTLNRKLAAWGLKEPRKA